MWESFDVHGLSTNCTNESHIGLLLECNETVNVTGQ